MAPKKGEKDKNQNIQVTVRCRPLSSDEKKKGSYNVADVNCERKDVTVKERLGVSAASKTFSFDKVFGPTAQQIDVYKSVCAPIIDEVLMGYNCTVFAYGQTGTGKTFTMEGERSDDPNISWEKDPLSGLIPRAMNQLFTRLQRQPDCEFSVRVSFLEIYNEELIDLLGAESVENPRLRIYEDMSRKGSCVIQGLEEVVVRSKDEVYDILQLGANRRQTAATLMNAHSSRSHSLFMVTIHIKENSVEGEELLKTGKLNLVDLAGSECIGRSGAVDKRAREAGQINQSLLTLGRVISALVEHAPHVPYRESKLTRLLQDSLGGRTKTSIIATISPASSNLEETLSTLDYAHRAKNIQNKPEVNQKLTKKTLLKEYNEEIERLRRDLQAARDKNGVFLAHENYEAMQTQIAQQTDKIKDLSDQIEMKLIEMEKLSELFADTKEELADTKEDLAVTTKNLDQTTQDLKVTRSHLRKTTQDRDEQKHLVGKHVKTETKLHQQATQLLYTSEEATGDVEGLHSKLDRKRKVEDHNETTQDSFRKSFRDNIDEMQESLKSHLANDLQHGLRSHQHLGELLDKRTEEVTGMSGELNTILKQVTDRVGAVVGSYETHTGLAQDWVKSLKEHVIKTRDEELCRQFDFHEQTFQSSMSTVETQLNNLTTELGSLSQFVQDTMNAHKSAVSKMVTEQLAQLERQRELVDAFHREQVEQHGRQSEHATSMVQSQHSLNQTLAENLLKKVNKLVHEMVAEQQQHLTGNVDKAHSGLAERKTHLDTYHHNSTDGIKVLSAESKTGMETIHKACDEKITVSQTHIDQLKAGVHSAMQTKLGLQQKVTEFMEQTTTRCTENATQLTSMAETHSQQLDTAKLAYVSAAEELSATQAESIKSLDSTQQSQHAEVQQSITTQQSAQDKHKEQISQWSDKMAADIEARQYQIETFLTEELAKDIPTGTTPQRRDFTYPRTLTNTDRHSLILGEFRKEYILEEAMNTPIPDDSFTSQASQGPPSLNLDDGDDQENEDGMNTSTDSALSSASVLSSINDGNLKNLPSDKQFIGSRENLTGALDKHRSESKENICMPPPPGVPKSRQTTVSRSNSASRTPGSKPSVVKNSTPGKKSGGSKNITPSNLPKAKGKLPLRTNNP